MLKAGKIADNVSGARTPFGRYCGKLKDFTAQGLGAVAGKGAIERSGIDRRNSITSSSATRSRLLAMRCMERGMWVCALGFRLRRPR